MPPLALLNKSGKRRIGQPQSVTEAAHFYFNGIAQEIAPNLTTRKFEAKSLTVLFQPDGRVVDFRFASRLANMAPAPAAPAPAFIPITIPVRK